MKKWLALLLAMMMAFALAACGNTDNKGNDAKEFARGSWAGNVYTNDSLGLTVTVPENWEIADDEELAELMGLTVENLSGEGLSEEFLKVQNTYDMKAQDSELGSNVIVMAENLAVSAGGTAYSEKDYAALIMNTLPEELGYSFDDGETVTIGGRDYYHIHASAYEGLLAQDYLFSRIGKYMAIVIISYSPTVAEPADMMAMLGGK